MFCGVLTLTNSVCSCSTSLYDSKRPIKLQARSSATPRFQCSNSSPDMHLTSEKFQNDGSMTGGAYDFERSTISLTNRSMSSAKKVTLVRHGLSSWNEESRVQGSSNLSILTETGVRQAERCRKALANIYFDQCFSSPISRAKNLEPVDAKERYPKEYTTWREDPANFYVNGVYPIRRIWATAREAWREILLSPGENFLVVTHKSMLRALICIAVGIPPERFRAIDMNNGGISVFNFNKRGEAMLQSLNMTAHMYSDHFYIY
ncbi:probable 2-carboxy-D-arabinitol-1-phosphatase isoform X3 [Alnus glutinosa]|uniref:probable 2-carboxy-D-arabinitol-1-phosphatase isoform X3 n=1 Tax=Alnus glutinosa TaxID=3517 RepID=UPI002D79BB95|nr:probable 2-carboxy-D-arabinitol-1-phosphatase isoform X3 [Alnus glutinosa]